MAIAMLVMFALIILLTFAIGFILIRNALHNPLKNVDVITADYIDETGTITGTRGYIEIPKHSLLQASNRQFGKFTEEVVQTGQYVIFTIFCDDGTGIVYSNDAGVVAVYGYTDAMGQITESFGVVENLDGTYRYQANLN